MSEIDIPKLTKEAEAGNGCSIVSQIQNMPFEESMKTLQAISEQAKIDRQADPQLPGVLLFVNSGRNEAYGTLSLTAFNQPELVSDNLSFRQETFMQRSQGCSEDATKLLDPRPLENVPLLQTK